MQITETPIKDVYAIEPFIFQDYRGTIIETNGVELREKLPHVPPFVKTNISTSKRDVLRGIHASPHIWKLFSCVYGHIQIVAVDCREDSPSLNSWLSWELGLSLDRIHRLSILMPPGVGTAHLVKSDVAVVEYHWTQDYDGAAQKTYRYDDPRFGIHWGWPILSQRDRLDRPNSNMI